MAVNNNGVVVGESSVDNAFVYVPNYGERHLSAAILSGGTAGADYVEAVAVNNAGQILVQGTLASDALGESIPGSLRRLCPATPTATARLTSTT